MEEAASRDGPKNPIVPLVLHLEVVEGLVQAVESWLQPRDGRRMHAFGKDRVLDSLVNFGRIAGKVDKNQRLEDDNPQAEPAYGKVVLAHAGRNNASRTL
jgi:hypothetical protein